MKIKNDPSGIDFNLQSQQNAWNIPVTADGRNKIGQNAIEYADQFGIEPIINAVEIDWNGAELELPEELGGNRTINTTGQLLKLIVEIANKLSNPEPVDIPVITLNPNTTQTIRITTSNSDDFKEITATITNGNASNISWSISPSNMQGTTGKTFKLNKTTGSNVTITANDSTPNQGTLKDLTLSEPTQNLTEGQISLSTGFNAGADKDYQCNLVASYPNASDVQLIIKCKVISGTSANNYAWHYDGVPSSLTYELDGNHTTITLKNTTNSDILVPANSIYVTNEDASNTVYSPQFTIPGKTSLITPEVTFNNPLSTSLDYQQQTSLEVLFTYNGMNVNGTLYLSTNKTELNITNPNINAKISHSNNWNILIRNDNNTSEDQTIAKGNITKLPFTFIPSDTNTYNTVTGYIKANQAITLSHQQQETIYYYYAGWTLPSTSNVDTIINETYPTSSSDNTQHAAGKKTTTKSSMDYTQGNLYYSTAKTYYYVLVPSNHAIYDSLGNNVIESTFTLQETITVGNQIHNIYKSNGTSRNIGAIIIR